MSDSVHRALLSAVLLLSAAPYFVGLGSSSLWDSNEAFYAETPREMLESGDWLNPSFNYQPRFNKPPLCYWVVASFYTLFGVSETAERIPIAIAAIVLITTAFFLGRASHSTEAGLIAALALAANPRFFMFSRRIIIDMFLAMFMALALLFFVFAERARAENRQKQARSWLILMYATIGLGVLTKGPVAMLLPGLAFLLYLALTRSLETVKHLMAPVGVLIIAVIVVPWYGAVYAEHGWKYIEAFILSDNLSRYTQPTWGPRRGPFFYIPVLVGDLFPWSIFLVGSLAALLARRRQRENRAMLLPISWMVVIVLFFSLSRSKEDLYILPSYPAAAVLIGGWLARAYNERARRGAAVLAGVLLSALGALIIYAGSNPATRYGIGGTEVIGGALIAGGLLAGLASPRGGALLAVAAIAAAIAAMNWTLAVKTLSSYERYKPVRQFCEELRKTAGDGALVGYYRLAAPSMVFYLKRPVFEYYEPEQLARALSSGSEVYCLMSAEDYTALKERLPAPTRILASHPVLRVKLRDLLTGAEPSEVVLISNRMEGG